MELGMLESGPICGEIVGDSHRYTTNWVQSEIEMRWIIHGVLAQAQFQLTTISAPWGILDCAYGTFPTNGWRRTSEPSAVGTHDFTARVQDATGIRRQPLARFAVQ